MTDYLSRVIDSKLDEMLDCVGGVLITGPKWCGKTTTAMQHCNSMIKLQDPDKSQGYLMTAQTKPSLLLLGDKPRLIDKWQMAPVLWDAVRHSIDLEQQDGLYILTGSTSVDKSTIAHTGTGRISKLVMHTMSLFESNESNGSISLTKLFDDKSYNIDGIISNLSIEQLIFAACRGGWPASLNKKSDNAKLFVAKAYVDSICENDSSTVDNVKRDPQKTKIILQSYARNISTLATNKTILKDVVSNYGDLTSMTLRSYVEALEKLFVIENIPAWSPAIRSASAMRATTKKEFTDPSIAVVSMNLTPIKLMQDLNTFGFIFETLCIRDLKVYSNALGGYVNYYHDRYGLEADCVLHLDDGRYALIEFKLGSREIEEGAEHLVEIQSLIREANAQKNTNIREPEFLMIVTGGEMAYTREDGVKIVPIGCLRE